MSRILSIQPAHSGHQLLIQACSQRKIDTKQNLPAFEMYDGVSFRILKKFRRERPSEFAKLKILIVSAKYGLIEADDLIRPYEKKMTPMQARLLQPAIAAKWQAITRNKILGPVLVNVGKLYLQSLSGIIFPASTEFTRGGIGFNNQELKIWLSRQN